jgi:L-ascorbate metabolism protein UlaG (beta-lactamase superfamily)
MIITYFGHSCFLVELCGKKILFDPFITGNPLATSVSVSSLSADYILVSHGHQDHTGDLIQLANQTGATVIASYEITSWCRRHGVKNIHPMNIGGHWMFDFGKVKCVNAVHSSSLPDGTYGGNPMGFLLESSMGNLYYAGDTALHYDMKLIGDFKKIHVAFLPLGNNFTMGIDNAVIAADFVKCNHIIGMHYDTMEMIKINHDEARMKFNAAGKHLELMSIGQRMEIKN